MSIWQRITTYFSRYGARSRTSKTVRFMFPALLGSVAAFSLFASSASTDDSFLFLETPTKAIEVGELYPVTIFASAASPINAVEFSLAYDANKVEVFGVDRGQSVITIWTEDPVITTDTVSFRGGTFQRGFLGEHQIATVNFRALETGQYTVEAEDVRFIAGDGEGTEVPAVEVPAIALSLFNFDESTTEEEITVAIKEDITTDINADGQVTLQDISAFMGAWSNRSNSYDFNGDGRMTFRDFSIILAEFFFQ